MSVVLDSSVLVAALTDTGADGIWAENILSSGSLHAPELIGAEVMNVLRRLELAKLITTPEANGAREDLMQLDIALFPFEPFAERVWALRHNLTSYDAWYTAVAEGLKLPLATLDGRLSRSPGISCDFLTPG
ncbi:MAG TPA: type II toxin-antitoxin system VapC family toxin [Steroidobacteraceae bacterium]